MKILLIDVNCKSGSTGKIVYDLHTNLKADGIESAICYGRGKKIKEDNIYRFSGNMEVYFHALMTRLTGLTGCYSFFSTRRLLQFIKEYNPDVVHIHELHGYFVNIEPVLEYLKKKRIRTIWTFHCEFMYTGRCGYSYDCDRWRTGCGSCQNIKEYPTSFCFDFSRKMHLDKQKMFSGFNNLTIVTPSKWLADKVRESFLSNKKIRVIFNGIDTDSIFYPHDFSSLKELHHITDEKVVLAVAPDIMAERKGGRTVVKLAERMKDEKIKFILVGVADASERFDDNIIAIARTENQRQLAMYYSMADVFVICSVMENFPTVCLESLCCGTPVCGFDTGGTKETAPGDLGIFVPYGDIEALRDAVLEMIERLSMTEKCMEYGKTMYSKTVMYENYKKLYFEQHEINV